MSVLSLSNLTLLLSIVPSFLLFISFCPLSFLFSPLSFLFSIWSLFLFYYVFLSSFNCSFLFINIHFFSQNISNFLFFMFLFLFICSFFCFFLWISLFFPHILIMNSFFTHFHEYFLSFVYHCILICHLSVKPISL